MRSRSPRSKERCRERDGYDVSMAFPKFESDRAIHGGRIGILEFPWKARFLPDPMLERNLSSYLTVQICVPGVRQLTQDIFDL
jgi:hypothetical protein